MENERVEETVKQANPFSMFFIALAVLVLLSAIGLLFLKVESVTVEGTRFSDPRSAENVLFPEEKDRMIVAVLWKKYSPLAAEQPFGYTVDFETLNSIRVTVSEPEPWVAAVFSDQYLILDGDGRMIGLSGECPEGLLTIEGFEFASLPAFSKPGFEGDGAEAFEASLKILRSLQMFEVPADRIRFSENAFFIDIGGVTVALGPGTDIEEKCEQIRNQYPYYEGLKGIMHMESSGDPETAERFYFEVTP